MRRRGALPLLSDAFFYGYTGMCAVAGAAGDAFGRSDVALISGFDRHDELSERSGATMMSCFLRAMEMGFEVLSLCERRRIYRDPATYRPFLSLMGSGIAARAVAPPVDGPPPANAYVFGGSGLLGLAVIFAHPRSTPRR